MALTDARGKPAGVSFLPDGETSLRAHAVLPRARVYHVIGDSEASSSRRMAWDGMNTYHVVAHGVPHQVELTSTKGHARLVSGSHLGHVLQRILRQLSNRHEEAGQPLQFVLDICESAAFLEEHPDLLGNKQPTAQEFVDAVRVAHAVHAPTERVGVGPAPIGGNGDRARDSVLLDSSRANAAYVKFRPMPDEQRLAELAGIAGISVEAARRVVRLLRLLLTADVDDRADYESLVRAVATMDGKRRSESSGSHDSDDLMFEDIVGYLTGIGDYLDHQKSIEERRARLRKRLGLARQSPGHEPLLRWVGDDLVPAARVLVKSLGGLAEAWFRSWLPEQLTAVWNSGTTEASAVSPGDSGGPVRVPPGTCTGSPGAPGGTPEVFHGRRPGCAVAGC